MGDRHISQKLKGKVLNSCITPTYLYNLETMAMTGKQQERLQVCGNNWMRRTEGVKRINKRRMEELREEVGGRESHREAGEEPAKVGWTCRKNGRGMIDEESGCAWNGRKKEKRKTETEMGGLREERFSGSGRGMENEGEG